MHYPAKKRPCRDDDRRGQERRTIGASYAANSHPLGEDLGGHRLNDRQIGRFFKPDSHEILIFVLVRLRSGGLDRRTFRTIEHTELDAGGVDRQTHEPSERIHLARDLAFGQAADGGIAAHLADRGPVERDQAGACPDPGCRVRGFDTGVAPSYDDAIKVVRFHSIQPRRPRRQSRSWRCV